MPSLVNEDNATRLKGKATAAGFPECHDSGRPLKGPPRASWREVFIRFGQKRRY